MKYQASTSRWGKLQSNQASKYAGQTALVLSAALQLCSYLRSAHISLSQVDFYLFGWRGEGIIKFIALNGLVSSGRAHQYCGRQAAFIMRQSRSLMCRLGGNLNSACFIRLSDSAVVIRVAKSQSEADQWCSGHQGFVNCCVVRILPACSRLRLRGRVKAVHCSCCGVYNEDEEMWDMIWIGLSQALLSS